MFKTTALAVLLSSAAVVAYAGNIAETPVEAPVTAAAPVEPFWAGTYAGVQLGYVFGEFDINSSTRPGDFDNDSVIGGLTFGYLWSVGNGWYMGPEFQYDFADVSVTDATNGDTASFDEIARLKLIAGREVGNGLLYASAGVAYASFEANTNVVNTIFDGFDGSDTNLVIGIGYDYRVSGNWTVGGEYMYHQFNGVGANGSDVDVNTVHLKATYRY